MKNKKEQSNKIMDNLIYNFGNDIEHKRIVFRAIQPNSNRYLK